MLKLTSLPSGSVVKIAPESPGPPAYKGRAIATASARRSRHKNVDLFIETSRKWLTNGSGNQRPIRIPLAIQTPPDTELFHTGILFSCTTLVRPGGRRFETFFLVYCKHGAHSMQEFAISLYRRKRAASWSPFI